jgi:hypothetical protein
MKYIPTTGQPVFIVPDIVPIKEIIIPITWVINNAGMIDLCACANPIFLENQVISPIATDPNPEYCAINVTAEFGSTPYIIRISAGMSNALSPLRPDTSALIIKKVFSFTKETLC